MSCHIFCTLQSLLHKTRHVELVFVLQVADFTQVLQQLPVSCMLAAAFITYLGKEPEIIRQAAVTQWSADLGVLTPWSLTALLASETELLTWKTQGERCTRSNFG